MPDDVSELSKSNIIDIGSHLITHNKIGTLPEQDAIYEIVESKKTLEKYTSKPVKIIGYPVGGMEGISDKTSSAIKSSYIGGCTCLLRRDELVDSSYNIHEMPCVFEGYFERVLLGE